MSTDSAMETSDHAAWQRHDGANFGRHLLTGTHQYATVFLDEHGVITGWSEGAYFITGHTAQAVIGKDFSLLFTPEDQQLKLDLHELKTVASTGFAEDERWHVRADGSKFWTTGVTMRTAPQGFVKLFRDATHLRLRTETLENSVRRTQAERARLFHRFAQIAHDLSNPLMPIRYGLESLRSADDAQSRTNIFSTLDAQLSMLNRLVEDLIDAAKVAHGKMSLEFETIELQSFVQTCVDGFAPQASEKEIQLDCVLPDVPSRVQVDPQRMRQVLANLIGNALKFTPRQGHVSVAATFDSAHFLVLVKDSGIGIGPNKQGKIFELFTQAHSGDFRDGLGIGLSVVKEIVELHDGTVEVRSEGVGKGSQFLIRIPIRRPTKQRLKTRK